MEARRVAAVGGMALTLAACGGGADEKDTEAVGTWSVAGQSLLFRFKADGTFAFDRANLDAPFAAGTYEVDGTTITLTTSGSCTDVWRWEVGEPETDDELHVKFLDPGCGVVAETEWMLVRLSS